MKKYTAVIFLFAFISFAENVEIYSQIRVKWTFIDRVQNEPISARYGVWAEYALTESELIRLENRGVPYEMVISDMAEFYASRLDPMLDMGGWRTYEMINSALDSLHTRFPALTTASESIAVGWDGNIVKAMKISDNPTADENEPEVLIAGGIHAREVITPDIVLAFAKWLLENYGTDETATHLVQKREIWVVPLMNPDGYRYNQITNPSGGGMWRKNRRNNGGSFGVDLNRNFTYMWGLDNIGSSPTPADETYRGPSAGSEPETQGFMAFVNSREFRTAHTFHSFAGLYLFPWGYTTEPTEDNDWFMRIGKRYAVLSHYTYGPGATTIYITNGDADDWLYGATTEHNKILCCTPEVGGSSDGFWPPLSRREALFLENLPACIICAQIAGSAPFLSKTWVTDSLGNNNGFADPGETVRMRVELENIGIEQSTAFLLPNSVNAGVTILTDTVFYGNIPSQGYATRAFDIRLSSTLLSSGDIVKIGFEIRDTSGYVTFDSTYFVVGTPVFINSWDFEASNGGFTSTGDWQWGVPTSGPREAFSGLKLWATRLDTNYRNNTRSQLVSPSVLIPSSVYRPRLSFAHWYEYEMPSGSEVYDGGTVRISTNGGTTWTRISPLRGYDGVAYASNPHVGGDSVFTGSSDGWRNELFNLEPFAGMTVKFMFLVGSDPYVTAAGWYLDDIAVIHYIETGIIDEDISKPRKIEISTYPNPFNASCRIIVNPPCEGEISLEIYDVVGRKISSEKLSTKIDERKYEFLWSPPENIPNGIYFIKVESSSSERTAKALLIR